MDPQVWRLDVARSWFPCVSFRISATHYNGLHQIVLFIYCNLVKTILVVIPNITKLPRAIGVHSLFDINSIIDSREFYMEDTQINTVGLFITKPNDNIPELLIIVNLSSGNQVKRWWSVSTPNHPQTDTKCQTSLKQMVDQIKDVAVWERGRGWKVMRGDKASFPSGESVLSTTGFWKYQHREQTVKGQYSWALIIQINWDRKTSKL